MSGALETAQIAILLVSVSFLASDFVAEVELPKILTAAEKRGVRILPVVLTPCSFFLSQLSGSQAINDPAKPLSGLSQHEQVLIWERVVKAVLEALRRPVIEPPTLPLSVPENAPILQPTFQAAEPDAQRRSVVPPYNSQASVHLAQQSRRPRPGPTWTEEGLFERLQELCSPEGVQAAKQFYTYALARGARLRWGTGKTLPAVTAAFQIGAREVSVFTLSEWPENMGGLSVNFDDMVSKGLPLSVISRLVETLRTIPGVKESYGGLEADQFKRRPSLSLDRIFTQPGAVKTLTAVFDVFLRA